MTDFEMEDEIHCIGFFVADHAVVSEGKLYVNGGYFSQLSFPVYPAIVPAMCLAAVVRVPFRHYHVDHSLTIRLEDADGSAVGLEARGQFRVGGGPAIEYGDPGNMPVAIPVNGLQLPRPGTYVFTLAVDDRIIDRYTIRAVQVASPLTLFPQPPRPPGPES
jgi:hypothetical protein